MQYNISFCYHPCNYLYIYQPWVKKKVIYSYNRIFPRIELLFYNLYSIQWYPAMKVYYPKDTLRMHRCSKKNTRNPYCHDQFLSYLLVPS